ncbi:hypothetical protein EJ03DRAFT_347197 [Teratosphaeria nubilosa]|uniref:Uncharacterized protein n=1 Tax=Teratosphaeria nubilosa TaxID=161662 RepID=A0A6G1LMY3_9PEZI|nr:hypothetical protein EJ03DRAFT_347197 [Teratosphaeria nubilosa]
MVTLRANPKTGIQRIITFDDHGEGTTEVSKLSQHEQNRLVQKVLEEKPPVQKQQPNQPQQQDLAEQLSRFRESEKRLRAQGLTKRQRPQKGARGKISVSSPLGEG